MADNPQTPAKKMILFVCTGNICRSPMAEGFLRQLMKDRTDLTVMSAGTGAENGIPASAYAVQAMKESGVDISGHRSRFITHEIIRAAHAVIVMTQSHRDYISNMEHLSLNKLYLLKEFDPESEYEDRDISDPIGGDIHIYRTCRDEIYKAVKSLALRL